MKLLLALIVVCLINGCVECNENVTRLLKYVDTLKTKYNLKTIPTTSSDDTIQVIVMLVLINIVNLNEKDEVIQLQYWINMMWNDYRMKWNATQFGKTAHIFVPLDSIWTPDVLIYNNAKLQTRDEITPATRSVQVANDGACLWAPRFEMSITQCDFDTYWFPFDTQSCDLIFEQWSHRASEVNVTAYPPMPIYTDSLKDNSEWDLVGTPVDEIINADGYSRITYTLKIRRKSLFYVVNLIFPYFLLSSIALFSLLLPASSCSDRMNIGITIVLALSVYQIIVTDKLPPSSDSTPIIVMYFMFVITICVVCVIYSMIIMHIYTKADKIPFAPIPLMAKRYVCEWMAELLFMMPRPSTPAPPPRENRCDIDANRRLLSEHPTDNNNPKQSVSDTIELETTVNHSCAVVAAEQPLLKEIKSLLSSINRQMTDKQEEEARNEVLMNDWRLAAAVIDRLCFIFIGCFFLIGTITFFIIFGCHP